MAIASTNITAPLSARIAETVSALAADYAKWQLYRDTLGKLRSLERAELRDLGLDGNDLRDVAAQAVYGTLR